MIANSHARSVEIGTAASDLPTPAVLVDLVRLEANLGSWQAAVTSSGARFRPHVKTRKVVETAARQIELGACGIASAKVSEAEVFVAAGIRDVVITSARRSPGSRLTCARASTSQMSSTACGTGSSSWSGG